MHKLTRIYCGRSKHDGSLIRLLDIAEFLKAEVATQYEAYTVMYTTGYWGGKHEESFVIELITKTVSHYVDFRPKQIANAYKKRFQQESVLITIQDIESTVV